MTNIFRKCNIKIRKNRKFSKKYNSWMLLNTNKRRRRLVNKILKQGKFIPEVKLSDGTKAMLEDMLRSSYPDYKQESDNEPFIKIGGLILWLTNIEKWIVLIKEL